VDGRLRALLRSEKHSSYLRDSFPMQSHKPSAQCVPWQSHILMVMFVAVQEPADKIEHATIRSTYAHPHSCTRCLILTSKAVGLRRKPSAVSNALPGVTGLISYRQTVEEMIKSNSMEARLKCRGDVMVRKVILRSGRMRFCSLSPHAGPGSETERNKSGVHGSLVLLEPSASVLQT
jgi:hypothetical protein